MENTESLDTEQVWKILENFSLSQEQERIAKTSFRTRAKWREGVLDFQFKFSPESIHESEKQEIETTMKVIEQKLKEQFKTAPVSLSYKIAECCGEDCFCCQIYAKNHRD